MATRSLGVLTLDLVARTGGFVQGMDKAQRRSAKWRRQVERDLKSVGNSFKFAAAAAAAGLGAMVVQTANSAREIRSFAMLSDTTTQEFQRLAYGSSRFGIQQDKLADILKDTNDRIGDFIQTGGGPMADFFEQIAPKVGVTAEQFAKLSGPDALQLYVDSLEKAGVSQKDMVFYMEAIASDASMLIPLLSGSGAEMSRLGDEAERTGNVFSEMEFEQLEEIKRGMDELTGAAVGMKNEIVLAALPAIEDLVDMLSDPQTLENAQALGKAIVTAMGWAVSAIETVVGATGFLAEELAAAVHGPGLQDIVRLEEAVERQESVLERMLNGPNRPPKSVIDEEIEKLDRLKERYRQGLALQDALVGSGSAPGASSTGGEASGATSGQQGDAAVYDIVPTNEQKTAADSVKDLGEKAGDGADAVKTFSDAATTSARALSAISGVDWGRGASGAMAGDQDNGGRTVRQRIEAGKDLSAYVLEPNPNAKPTWSTGLYDAAGNDMARAAGNGGGSAPNNRGKVRIEIVGGAEGDVEGDDAFIKQLANALSSTASSV